MRGTAEALQSKETLNRQMRVFSNPQIFKNVMCPINEP